MKTSSKLLATFFIAIVSIIAAHDSDAATRSLTCTNKSGKIEFGICGIRGCPVTVTVGDQSTDYVLNRTKNQDGSLKYTTRTGSVNRCNINISALRFGLRTTTLVSCASSLKNSKCTISN